LARQRVSDQDKARPEVSRYGGVLIMKAEHIFELMDGQQQCLGQVRMEREEAGLVLGEFTPAPAFASIEVLFREFEAAADRQALHRVEELDAAIAARGLRLRSDGSGAIEVRDVQIWSDGGFSCRLVGQFSSGANGSLPARKSVAGKSA
jgi:hypothetical protein